MRIVLFASGEFALPTLSALREAPHRDRHEIVAVVTQPDRPAGRGKAAKPTPVRIAAQAMGLPAHAIQNVNDESFIERLRELHGDLGLVIAFGQKITAPVRDLFTHQCVNLHASLLPAYRGAAPFQWAVINGEKRTGVTVFELVDRMDAGPIYVQRDTPIRPNERACELHDRLAVLGVDAVRETLAMLEQEPPVQPAPQDDAKATRAPKLSKTSGYIRFDQPVENLVNRINGLWSWPGATCEYAPREGSPVRVTIAHASVAPIRTATVRERPNATAQSSEAAYDATPVPGTFNEDLHVAAAGGLFEILEIQPQGKRVMAFRDFVNGRHVQPGDCLISIEM